MPPRSPFRHRLSRRLAAVAFATSAAAGFAACTIEFIDNDPGSGSGSLDAGSTIDADWITDAWDPGTDGAWGQLDAADPWPVDGGELDGETPLPIDGGGAPDDANGNVCGDGLVQLGEQCDNGQPGINTATCDRDCTFVACGDALANFPAGEQCDTGNWSVSCDIDCTARVCGDGLVNAVAGEQCDDGNAVDTDGCRNDCTLP